MASLKALIFVFRTVGAPGDIPLWAQKKAVAGLDKTGLLAK
jgi:hypothetical protein